MFEESYFSTSGGSSFSVNYRCEYCGETDELIVSFDGVSRVSTEGCTPACENCDFSQEDAYYCNNCDCYYCDDCLKDGGCPNC